MPDKPSRDHTVPMSSLSGRSATIRRFLRHDLFRGDLLYARLFRKRILLTAILSLLTSLAVVLSGDQVVRYFSLASQREAARQLVEEINTFVTSHFQVAVTSLAKNKEVLSVVAGNKVPDNENLLDILSSARGVLGASIIYLMDAGGTVVGCSPYDDGQTLTGKNYKFRSYFTEALAGRSGTYAAIGVTTGKRGLYFSEPVVTGDKGSPSGVMVIKVPMDSIDFYINRLGGSQEVLLLSQEGIVLSTTRGEWLFKSALPLSPRQRSELIRSRKFHDQTLDSMPFQVNEQVVRHGGRRYIVQQQQVGLPGWKIITLKPAKYPYGIVSILVVSIMFIGFTIILCFVFAYREEKLSEEVRRGREKRKRVEESRLATRQELETILATSLVGITLVKDGIITNVNEKMSDVLGYPQEELLGKDIRMFFPNRETYRKFVRTYARQLLVRDLEHIEYDLLRKDGRVIPCSLSGKAVDQNNLSRGIVWVVEDILDRKKVEEDLERARKEAVAASQAKSEFLANMSHEIRTPMNGIIGIAEMLHDLEPDPHKSRQLELIITSVKRLMKIINDILDFSKNEMEKLVLDNVPFSIRAALNEVLGNFAVQAREKKLTLELVIKSDVPDIVVGDETRLMQVMYNLVGNGLKFTEEGGVFVRLGMSDDTGSGVRGIQFEVIDTGIGISADKQDTIFEAFAQADSTHSRRYGGTGLGLPISRRLVQLMGGELRLESRKGIGSRFWFSIPLLEACPLPQKNDQEVSVAPFRFSKNTHPARILLAEDDLINTSLAVSLLELAGYTVTAVTNGRDAVREFVEGAYDCILMDVQMPDIDGYEAVRQIRLHEEKHGGHVPIIAMTACAMEGDREKCLEEGMDDYLPKPIDRRMLFRLLRQHVNTQTEQQGSC